MKKVQGMRLTEDGDYPFDCKCGRRFSVALGKLMKDREPKCPKCGTVAPLPVDLPPYPEG